MHMPKRNPAAQPPETPWPKIPPEENPDDIPVNPLLPEEDPATIPDERPFKTPPYEIPQPDEEGREVGPG